MIAAPAECPTTRSGAMPSTPISALGGVANAQGAAQNAGEAWQAWR